MRPLTSSAPPLRKSDRYGATTADRRAAGRPAEDVDGAAVNRVNDRAAREDIQNAARQDDIAGFGLAGRKHREFGRCSRSQSRSWQAPAWNGFWNCTRGGFICPSPSKAYYPSPVLSRCGLQQM